MLESVRIGKWDTPETAKLGVLPDITFLFTLNVKDAKITSCFPSKLMKVRPPRNDPPGNLPSSLLILGTNDVKAAFGTDGARG